MCELYTYNKYVSYKKTYNIKCYPFRNDEKSYLKEQALADPVRMDPREFWLSWIRIWIQVRTGQTDLFLVKLAKNNTVLH